MPDTNKPTSFEADLIVRERLRSLEAKNTKLRIELGIVVAVLVYCLFLVTQHTSLSGFGLHAGQVRADGLTLGEDEAVPGARISSRLISMESADGKLHLSPNSTFLRLEAPDGVLVDFALKEGNVIVSRTDKSGVTTDYNLTPKER